jgi:hypothetical protein
MSTMLPVAKDDPRWISWQQYIESEEGANSMRWAKHPEHSEGSMWAAFIAGRASRDAEVEELVEVLRGAERFIRNGIELGYIRMPTDIDPAHETLPALHAALAKHREGVKP